MRTPAEIHSRSLGLLVSAFHRPSMAFGFNIDTAEGMMLHLLDTLSFIDRREAEWDAIRCRFVVGCRWVRGHFEFQHRPFPKYVNEVASVYAEVAHNLGYFTPERLLTEAEMANLVTTLEEPEFKSHDVTEPELHARFGKPSHMVVGGPTTVACYGCEKVGLNWVHFDLARRLPWDANWLPTQLLRDFRFAEASNRMHLMPVGERWANDISPPVADS